MNAQEIFDTVLTHLRQQGKRAWAEDGGCAYRGANGTKCAVGVLIPDELYDPIIEGRSTRAFMGEGPGTRAERTCARIGKALPLLVEHNILLADLQSLHDNGGNWDFTGFNTLGEEWAAKIAKSYGLNYTPPADMVLEPRS